ncbi:MAG: type II toxin-antitoxin system death-on-curing family toxin [Polynucleobacter sp.]
MSQFVVVNVDQVLAIHEVVIGANELQGLAKNKSLVATLERVHNRLQYGFISDAFDLAACYATFIAKAHCFHDANKRTAATVLAFILDSNGISIDFNDYALGDWIIDVASDKNTELDFAAWLRAQTKED